MVFVSDVDLAFGQVTYRGGTVPVPDRIDSSTAGDVEVNVITPGRRGESEHFEVRFRLACSCEAADIRFQNDFEIVAKVHGLSKDAPYSRIEDEAVRQLAPMLRGAAQRIEEALGAEPPR